MAIVLSHNRNHQTILESYLSSDRICFVPEFSVNGSELFPGAHFVRRSTDFAVESNIIQ